MGVLIQRKRFEAAELAVEAARGFEESAFKIPDIRISTEVREIDGGWWVYVTQEGDMVTGDEPLLPEYEAV